MACTGGRGRVRTEARASGATCVGSGSGKAAVEDPRNPRVSACFSFGLGVSGHCNWAVWV